MDKLVERAWRVLNEGFFWKRMGGSRLGRDTPLNVALAGLTIRAWDDAFRYSEGEEMEEPAMVAVLRWERLDRMSKRKEGVVSDGGGGGGGGVWVNVDVDGVGDEGLGLGFGSEIYDSGLFEMVGGQSGFGDSAVGIGHWGDLMQEFEM